jgi:hypothetical protein
LNQCAAWATVIKSAEPDSSPLASAGATRYAIRGSAGALASKKVREELSAKECAMLETSLLRNTP